jgi:alkylation response protein AidB-like acyl-CoA dehydrogenase
VPRELWRRAGELGLLCLTVPEEYGGAGVDFSYSAIVVEELSRAGATGPIFYLHSDIVAPYLVQYGTEAQKQRWLPGLARGEPLCAISVTEPNTGSDVASVALRATRTEGGWLLNGAKTWCTFAGKAGAILVLARTDAVAKPPLRGPTGVWMGAAPPEAFVHVGAGNNIIYVDPVNDVVAVVRWIDTNASVNGFVERLLAALPPAK